LQEEDDDDHDQRRQVDAAADGDQPADAGIERFQHRVQAAPDLRHQRLAQVQHLEVDQPGHDHMDQNDPLRDVQDQKQRVAQRNHVRTPLARPNILCPR
jgi:hypothetical protein